MASISARLKRKFEGASETDRSSSRRKLSKQDDDESSSSTIHQYYTVTCDMAQRMKAIDKVRQGNLLASEILKIETKLCDELMKLDYGVKVTHVYNPVDYAYKPHIEWYRRYCRLSAQVLMIGENPGPFGGTQTGVSNFQQPSSLQ